MKMKMKIKSKAVLALLLSVILSGTLLCAPALAIAPSVTSLNAAYSNGIVSIAGETTEDINAVALMIYRGDTLLRLETAGVTAGVNKNVFTSAVGITLAAGTYTVKAADYAGGAYYSTTFTVAEPEDDSGGNTPPAAPAASPAPTSPPVTTTETKTEGNITTETVTTALTDSSGNSVTQTATTSTDSGTNNVDFTAVIESGGSSAPLSPDILNSASGADTASVTVMTQEGSITFDKDALEGMKEVPRNRLTQ